MIILLGRVSLLVIRVYCISAFLNKYNCGIPRQSRNCEKVARVANGTPICPYERPWTVQIYDFRLASDVVCTGVLLTEEIVLTAAHCVTEKPQEKDDNKKRSRYLRVSGETSNEENNTEYLNDLRQASFLKRSKALKNKIFVAPLNLYNRDLSRKLLSDQKISRKYISSNDMNSWLSNSNLLQNITERLGELYFPKLKDPRALSIVLAKDTVDIDFNQPKLNKNQIKVKSFVVHEDYHIFNGNYYLDLALIKLAVPIDPNSMGKTVRPICFPTKDKFMPYPTTVKRPTSEKDYCAVPDISHWITPSDEVIKEKFSQGRDSIKNIISRYSRTEKGLLVESAIPKPSERPGGGVHNPSTKARVLEINNENNTAKSRALFVAYSTLAIEYVKITSWDTRMDTYKSIHKDLNDSLESLALTISEIKTKDKSQIGIVTLEFIEYLEKLNRFLLGLVRNMIESQANDKKNNPENLNTTLLSERDTETLLPLLDIFNLHPEEIHKLVYFFGNYEDYELFIGNLIFLTDMITSPYLKSKLVNLPVVDPRKYKNSILLESGYSTIFNKKYVDKDTKTLEEDDSIDEPISSADSEITNKARNLAEIKTIYTVKDIPSQYRVAQCVVEGYGRLNYDSPSKNGRLWNALVNPYSSTMCAKTSEYTFNRDQWNLLFCASDISTDGTTVRDSCSGDSGGPLSCMDEEGKKFELLGIISMGFKCAYSCYPGLYVNVGIFRDWISDQVDFLHTTK